ncbi:hypothetical protein [Mongoliitalea daihaiensis]|uniref:hypothetical protein n=1 Tax=Mongoliitalea daihaiensis TaxID=2782006 RepID=UPI001F455140|nr:hypothetical protein [Mongoliitalea daihaiensis]UJP63672.1 hypothetical protein IPZ59_12600 [Mongoliitalea daihaiensis]
MKKNLLFFLLIGLYTACTESDPTMGLPTDVFEVTTWGIDGDCGFMVFTFDVNDVERMEELVGSTAIRRNQRMGLSLDRNRFAEENLRLRVRIRKPLESELGFACNTRGIPPRPVVVVSAQRIN